MEGSLHMKGESPYFVTFLNFYFYFGVTPFKIVFDESSERYSVKMYKFHRIWCVFSHTGSLLFLSFSMQFTLLRLHGDTANESTVLAVVFETASNVFNVLSVLLLAYTLFRKEKEIMELVEKTRLCCTPEKSKKVQKLICIILLIASFLMFVIFSASFTVLHLSKLDVDSQSYILQVILILLASMILFQFSYIFTISFLMMMGLFLAMGQQANEFKAKMSQLSKFTKSNIYLGRAAYLNLKRTTKLFRDIFGNMLFTNYMAFICFLIEFPYVFLSSEADNAYKATLIYFFVVGLLWIAAAEFHQTVKCTVKEWTQYHVIHHHSMSWEERFKLSTLSSEISSDATAISGKFLSMTYSSIGSMIGIIITYSIVIFQLNPR